MAKPSIPGIAVAAIRNTLPPATKPFNPAPLMIPALPILKRRDEQNQAAQQPALPPNPPHTSHPAWRTADFAYLPPLPSVGERVFPAVPPALPGRGEALPTSAVDAQSSDLPRLNAAGRWMKQNPITGTLWGGIADYLSHVGTPNLTLQNANAAAWDLMPLGAAFKAPKVISAVGRLTPVQQGFYGGLGDVMIPNPFEQPNPNQSVLNKY